MDHSKIAIVSFGCAKNLVDSEELMGLIGTAGGVVCDRAEDADILIVNTCGFIEEAKQESIRYILDALHLKKTNPSLRVIVTGCLAQRYAEALRSDVPEVDAIIGLRDFDKVLAACRLPPPAGTTGRLRLTPRHYAYLKVSEGCNNRCSYCAIPSIRGPLQSTPMDSILAQARELAADGTIELNLVGQDTAAYGLDMAGRALLPELLARLHDIDGLQWIRVLYTHPRHLTDEIIQAMASHEKVCPYIDLPIQHINGRILTAMNRKIEASAIKERIAAVRSVMPGVFIRTSIIVGFPGETDAEFQELLAFVRETRFERLGAFAYSREKGTAAFALPDQVPEEIKDERLDRLMTCQQEIAFRVNRGLIGMRVPVILDRPSDDSPDVWEGRTQGDAPDVDGMIYITGPNLRAGRIVTVRITGTEGYDLVGEYEDS
ncbi:MAG: 30S ribosomal protein S12 methylthiotransferase RimO [Planctomycetes bacterium]|nr:30S ribosomal protein S12 methylthiotransferase RimO [Planctomycetota bacterium]